MALDLEMPKPKFVKEVLEKSMRYLNTFNEGSKLFIMDPNYLILVLG